MMGRFLRIVHIVAKNEEMFSRFVVSVHRVLKVCPNYLPYFGARKLLQSGQKDHDIPVV